MKTLSINRNFYFFGIFFLGLSSIMTLFESVIRFKLGPQLFTLQSFLFWFALLTIVNLIWSIILLIYCYYKKYKTTFSLAIPFTIAALCLSVIIVITLASKKEVSFYYPTYLVFTGTAILFALSLIFSKAGERSWLRATGIFSFIIYLILMSILIGSKFFDYNQIAGEVEKLAQWLSLAASILPVLFIMNFLSELRIVKVNYENRILQRRLKEFMVLLGVVAFSATLFVAGKLASESSSKLYWKNQNAKKTEEFVQQCETRTFGNSEGDTLRYLLLKPQDYDTQKKYPLVISLPYGGYEAQAAQLLANDNYKTKYPAFLFVPYCPPGAGWGGIPNYPTIDTLVFEAINALEKEVVGIDAKRRYVTGISRGGYGSWHFICTRPEMFAAAIPICGGGDPTLASNIADVSVWAFHGEKDKYVPVSGSRDMIEAINKAGGNPKYTEFPNEAHNIWHQVRTTPGLLDWLFAQKRD